LQLQARIDAFADPGERFMGAFAGLGQAQGRVGAELYGAAAPVARQAIEQAPTANAVCRYPQLEPRGGADKSRLRELFDGKRRQCFGSNNSACALVHNRPSPEEFWPKPWRQMAPNRPDWARMRMATRERYSAKKAIKGSVLRVCCERWRTAMAPILSRS
jgi:hypothetical protein